MTSNASSNTSPSPAPSLPARTRFQKFEPRLIDRRAIRNAPYNPRTIEPHAKEKLRRLIRKKGLLEALVWNELTGNLVSGHQRLAVLDLLEGTDAYSMDVNVVKLSEAEEIESNIAFNNPAIQGEWDMLALGSLLKKAKVDLGINLDATGWDPSDIDVAFDDPDLSRLFTDSDPLGDEVRRLAEDAKPKKKKKSLEETKDRKFDLAREDTEIFMVVMFRDREERDAFRVRIGLEDAHGVTDRYIDADRIVSHLRPVPEHLMKPAKSGRDEPRPVE